ncbi:MAG: SDR family NAD(P)-dependent oxidoreductase [Planctomycetes bacterium]|nr:SDR family NAD(P)-dependent oxidoreductase [Planctomycetota bacterium]
MKRTYKHALVIGASSGIGEELAVQLARQGARVAVVARRAEELERVARRIREAGGTVFAHAHDVRSYAEVDPLFDRIVDELGGLDCAVYAAGVMPRVAEGEYDFAKDRAMLEVNLVGCVAWLNRAALHCEAQRSGTILGVSSIAGERGRRGAPVYCTSKAGMTAYLEALRNRCSRYGVNVVTAKPGFIDTPMTHGMTGLFWLISAEEAARRILRLADGRGRSGFVPWRWSLVAFVLKRIPSFLFRKSNI